MFVISSARGARTIFIVAVVTIAVGAIVQRLPGALGHPQPAYLAASIGLFAATAPNWFVGKRVNAIPPRDRSVPVASPAFFPLLALPDAIRG